ncbi:MAG TPA: hypothetical protein K8U79_13180 [Clostridium perfringens]|nr:hypothetical protein [Clostridium perfringens]
MEYTQEMVNKVDEQITKDLASGKSIDQVEKEIKKKIAEMRPNKISSVYNVTNELVKIVDKIDTLKADLKANKSKIDKNYKVEIVMQKERELELDFIADLESLRFDLNRVREKDLKYKQEAIANNKLDPMYQEGKKEAFNVLLQIGHKLEADLVVELLQPLIEAKDLSSIRILSKTASKENKIAYIEAIRKVEKFTSMEETDLMVREVSKYLNNKGKEKSLSLIKMIHSNKNN